MYGSHSLPGEPSIDVISRLETQQGKAATHSLESQGQALSAGLISSEVWQPLTSWRAEDRHRQQALNARRYGGSHSLSREPRTGIVSRYETQWGMVTTHKLERRAPTWSGQSI